MLLSDQRTVLLSDQRTVLLSDQRSVLLSDQRSVLLSDPVVVSSRYRYLTSGALKTGHDFLIVLRSLHWLPRCNGGDFSEIVGHKNDLLTSSFF